MTVECREKRLEQIMELLEKGLTRTQIGERVGLSRDQVQGIIARVREKEKKKVTQGVKPATLPAEVRRQTPSLPSRVDDDLPIVASGLSFDPPAGKLSIFNVKAFHCRYPDADGFFCGERINRASYCEHHYRLCYTPMQRKVKPWRNSLPSPSVNFA